MKRVPRIAVAAAILVIIPFAWAKDDKWVEARSDNFIVVSNASPQQARNTAIQFEQIRSLFQQSLPYTKDHPTPVIIILAAKDENTLRDLLPEYWAEKGRAHPAGIFIGSPFQLSIAVRLSGMRDNAYEAVYHEYYHSVTVPYFPNLPLWLSEGLADFYGNSQIEEKTAALGMPEPGLVELLHQQSLVPLSALFQVDQSSPYYNESNKVSIFYAESWALTHYFMLGDKGAHREELGAYLRALGQGATQQEAAKALGDLNKLQKALQSYVGNTTFYEFRVPAPEKVPDAAIHVRSISEAESDAYRAGFLLLHKQFKEADELSQDAIRLDSKLALAQQSLGISFFLQDKFNNAVSALTAAIQLDPNVTLTRYLRAEAVSRAGSSDLTDTQVEDDLRAAITSNPNFAPAYGLLATHLAAHGENLAEALAFAKKGVALEPGNSSYQLELAQVLVRMKQFDQAKTIAVSARSNAPDPVSRANADRFIDYLNRVRDAESKENDLMSSMASTAAVDSTDTETDSEKDSDDDSQDQNDDGHKRIDGTVTNVQCKVQVMDITVMTDDGLVKLHSVDNTKFEFISDLPFKSEEFWPCRELKGRIVRVTYAPSDPTKAKLYQGEIGKLEIKR